MAKGSKRVSATTLRVGFVGFGRMGSALALGAVEAGVLKTQHVAVYDTDASALKRAHAFRTAKSLGEVVERSELIFLCVKPQVMRTVLAELGPLVGAANQAGRQKKCFVSIAAGVTLEILQRALGPGVPVIRVMPNTPALLGAGMSAVSAGSFASPSHVRRATAVLAAVGDVVTVPENLMDAVTAVSGSGPAYFFYLTEAIAASAKELGLSDETARRLAHQTACGAGVMLKNRPESAEELRRQVTSPGGTTAAAMEEFETKGFKEIVQRAIKRAAERSKELGG